MKTFVEGLNISLTVPFQRDGEPFVPDANSITYDLRGQDGSLLQTAVAVPNVTDSVTYLQIAQTYNDITSPNEFEKRMVVVYATVGGEAWSTRINYRLCQWLNFTACNEDVRTFIGIGPGELPDCEIDLISSYWDCDSWMSPYFEPALIAGDETERQANRAIVAQAVLLLLPSLMARVSQMETDGTKEAMRFPVKDFSDLENRASNQLSRAINIVTSRQIVTPVSIVYAPSCDPVFPYFPWMRW